MLNSKHWEWIALGVVALFGLAAQGAEPASPSAEDLEFFEKRVRPVLIEHCYACHSGEAGKQKGGLRLDSRDAILRGGDIGPAATPSQPDKSLIIEAIGYQSESIQMPPAGKIPDAQVAALTEWVRRGLPYPAKDAAGPTRATIDWNAARQHWAFRPLASPSGASRHAGVPDGIELRTSLDPWIAAARHQHQLSPAPPADRRTLLRRLKLDLLGLPPSLEEIAEFQADEGPDATERLVDRLLAAPSLGERWGRLWLDVARYCDIPESWREGEAQAFWYRDWVIRSMNHDRPFHDFVRRQLAADLLPDSTPADNAALGFLGLSPSYWKELKLDHLVIQQVVSEEWEERIEALGGAFLGLTLACARCHDHKFEPVSIEDYYALAGVLASVKQDDRLVVPTEEGERARQARARAKQAQGELEKAQAVKPPTDENNQRIAALQAELAQLRATPGFDIPPAYGVIEASLHVLPDGPSRTKLDYRPGQPQDVAIQIRGNPGRLGTVVPRGFLTLFAGSQGRSTFREGSGRRELADALVGEAGPLTARVIVNRIWKQHFDRGLVSTPSNFGTQSEPPSHPELLEDLTSQFVANDWSLKWLHREIVLSATYRQASRRDAAQDARDPDNIWLARMPVRRVDVETWRDAMLVVANDLDQRIGGPSLDLGQPQNHRRTVYGVVKRRELSDLLRLYDFPDPVSHAASRLPTTTPLQQLFVLNSPFLRSRSEACARRWLATTAASDTELITTAYRDMFGREPHADERQAATEFLASLQQAGRSRAEAWSQFAQVLLGGNEFSFVD